ncbi:MAG TPA: hypothetical protein VGH38_14140 [Bryobacteraceae bacterium]
MNKLIRAVLLFVGFLAVWSFGQTRLSSTDWHIAHPLETAAFQLVRTVGPGEPKPIFTISRDGVMTFAEEVTPTEAAKEFAQALKQTWPDPCTVKPAADK